MLANSGRPITHWTARELTAEIHKRKIVAFIEYFNRTAPQVSQDKTPRISITNLFWGHLCLGNIAGHTLTIDDP